MHYETDHVICRVWDPKTGLWAAEVEARVWKNNQGIWAVVQAAGGLQRGVQTGDQATERC